jgi:predicted permease
MDHPAYKREMRELFKDLIYAFRMLWKSPGVTATIILSLAIGIGANTAIFSVVHALLLRPLPYPDPDRLAILWLRSPGLNIPQDWPSPGQYIDIQQQSRSFEALSISRGGHDNLTGRQQPERVETLRTSSNLFQILGAQPHLGRLLLPEEDKPGKPPVAILSYAAWQRYFGGDPQIVGKTIILNGNAVPVAGVLRSSFRLDREVMDTVASNEKIDIYMPLPLGADAVNRRGDENYNIVARLKSGVTPRQAQADIDVIAARIREKDKRDPTYTISVVPLFEQVVGNARRAVLVLLGSVALVLLIACANVANLLLSRATGRQKEIAIRTALGARWQRLVRQLLTESVLLGALGGAAGLAVAWWCLYILRTINPGNIPRMTEIGIDGGVLAFTLTVSILTGVVFGLAPALRTANVDLNIALKAGGRSSQGAGGFNPSRHRLRGLLVVGELGLSLILLAGAGLLIRSFIRLSNVPPGFNPSSVISMRMSVSGPKYRTQPPGQAVAQFYEALGQRLAQLPGIKAQGGITTLPLTPTVGWGSVSIEGYTPPPEAPELQVDFRIATTDYFRAMEIPLRKGRFFSEHDTRDGLKVAIIDEKMAQRFWPREDPVGKRLRPGSNGPWLSIAGVVGSVKQYGLDIDGRMVLYLPHSQSPSSGMHLVARTTSDPAAMASTIVREIHALDADAPVYDVRTMEGRLYDSLARQRFSMTMLGAFAAFALALAAVGIYGVMSYLVTQGTHDIGVRIALGAPRSTIVRMVVRQGMTLAAVGIAAGLVGAVALTRLMQTLLFGVTATDVLTFTSVAVFLGLIALAASYVPALRATRVDPLVALREE